MEIAYTDQNYRQLMAELKTLSTFGEADSWEQRAKLELDVIGGAIERISAEMGEQQRTLDRAREEHRQKAAWVRMFSTPKDERKRRQIIRKYQGFVAALGELAAKLQEAIDFLPESAEVQKALLKELGLRKIELQAEKEEVAASKKVLWRGPRQQNVKAGNLPGGLVHAGKLTSSQRRAIRYEREARLLPIEEAKEAIERQLLKLERDIAWIERFS